MTSQVCLKLKNGSRCVVCDPILTVSASSWLFDVSTLLNSAIGGSILSQSAGFGVLISHNLLAVRTNPLLTLPRSEYVGKLNCVSLCSRLAIRQSINAYGHTRRVPTYCDRLILKCIIICIKPPLELSDLLVVVK